jgi:hypothetical protein
MDLAYIILNKKVEEVESQVAILSLDPTTYTLSNPYIIRNITGLDADEINPSFYGNNNGATLIKYMNMHLKPRVITMRIILNPNYASGQTPSSLRDDLYRAISSTRSGKLVLEMWSQNDWNVTGSASSRIEGLVVKFESFLQQTNPEVQLTFRCDFPYFRNVTPTTVSTGALSHTAPILTDNVSTAPHGFKFSLSFGANTSSFSWSEALTNDWTMSIVYSFLTGDVLWFSSQEDDRYLYRVRSGVKLHLMSYVSAGYIWPIMFPGTNNFAMSTGTFSWTSFSYYQTYWGV